MSGEREELIKTLDTLKERITKILDAQEQLEADAETARNARREAEEKAWAVEEKVKGLTEELEAKKSELEETSTKLKALETEAEELRKKLADIESNREEEVKKLIEERDSLKKEMDEITEQLTRVSELYRETAAEKDKLKEKVDVSDLLAIYITLIETVFGGKPHARVLYTLHNTGTAIPRKNIESSTGIMATAVIKAIHDLRNAGLVSYDDETQEVRLIKDIF
ncbi:MAG: hypothetical protein K9W43_06925 [Candidatus Thorarchaeota archaeon]|nr:hypothetical protein [Candidatus Thorarchaeota archaeon]